MSAAWRSPTPPKPHQIEFSRWRRGEVDGVLHPRCLCEGALGVGKTLIGTEEILKLVPHRPSAQTLVLAVTANLETVWGEQLPRHAPGLPFTILNMTRAKRTALLAERAVKVDEGFPKKPYWRIGGPAHVWVAGHEDLPGFGRTLAQYFWDFIIIDESARFRTASAQRVGFLTGHKAPLLRSDFALALTGMPVVKSPADLYPTLKWLGAWRGSKAEFCVTFMRETELGQWELADEEGLLRLLATVRFQVPPSAVIPRTWRYDRLTLPKWQREQYRRIQRELRTRFTDENGTLHEQEIRSRLSEFLRLTQVTAGFEAVDIDRHTWRDDNVKAKHLIENVLPELTGECAIVWVVFRPEAENLTRLLNQNGRRAVAFYGSGPGRDEANREAYRAWKEGRADTFVSTLAKGSTGLNLPEASIMVYVSRDCATERAFQSLGRNHRLDTTHAQLRVIVLECSGTFDENTSRILGDDYRQAARLTSLDLKAALGE